MSLIVKDEVDIIAENIKYHHQNGVDAFVVLDNGSTDGTREILADLCSSYDMDIIDDPSELIQDKIATRLAQYLRLKKQADWLISNDADEFWVPRTGDLKSQISSETPVLSVNRYNLLPTKKNLSNKQYRFFHNIMMVVNPLGPQPPAPDPAIPLNYPMMLRTLPPKIMCSISGLEAVHKGNHRVSHTGNPGKNINDITIFHFPLRDYDNFKSKIFNHSKSFKYTRPNESWHLKRWFACCQKGTLKDEYDSMILTDDEAKRLISEGIIKEDRTLNSFFEKNLV